MNSPLFLLAILALNFAVSWWNARCCGRAWVESKAIGGTPRLLVWCGAIQSAIGFSMAFLIPLLLAAHALDPKDVTDDTIQAIANLWYVAILIPALGSGLAIMIESWIRVYRERSLSNIGVASYNTLVEVHNAMSAIDGLGPAVRSIGTLFSGRGDARGKLIVIAVLIVAVALAAGIILTAVLIYRYAGTVPLPNRSTEKAA